MPADAAPQLGPEAQELDGPILDEDAGLDSPVDLAKAEEPAVVLKVAPALEAADHPDAERRIVEEGEADAVVGGAEPRWRTGPAETYWREAIDAEIVRPRIGGADLE